MSKTLRVAWRDFRHTVMTRAFLIAVVGMPLLMIGVTVVAGIMTSNYEEPPLVGTVAVVDPTGAVVEAAAVEFDAERIARGEREQLMDAAEAVGDFSDVGQFALPESGAGLGRGEVRIAIEAHDDASDAAIDALAERVRAGDLLAVAVVDEALLRAPAEGEGEGEGEGESPDRGTFRLLVGEELTGGHTGLIERRVGEAIVRARVANLGADVDELRTWLDAPRSATEREAEDGTFAAESAGVREFRGTVVPMLFMILLWISTFSTGNHLMMSTIEEKSNKVMEVLLSAVSPLQLMAGKILGQGLVGLIIVGVYASLGVVALLVLASLNLIDPMQLVYLAIYFLMGYFMVASLMAAVGSAVSDLREANSLLTPVMVLLMIPLFLWFPITQDPNGIVATVFSFIPPATPFVMILRIATDEGVPFWQIPVTIVWGYACMLGMVWLASRIFRVGVLMTGKPPSPLELIKWVRYS